MEIFFSQQNKIVKVIEKQKQQPNFNILISNKNFANSKMYFGATVDTSK